MVPAIGPGRSTGPIAVLRARGPHRRCGPLAPPRRLEAADAVRRTEPRGAVVAGLSGTEVAAHRVRREFRPLCDVVEARPRGTSRPGVACERVDTRDGRCEAHAGDRAEKRCAATAASARRAWYDRCPRLSAGIGYSSEGIEGWDKVARGFTAPIASSNLFYRL